MKPGLRAPVARRRAQSIALIDQDRDQDRDHDRDHDRWQEPGSNADIRTGKAKWQ